MGNFRFGQSLLECPGLFRLKVLRHDAEELPAQLHTVAARNTRRRHRSFLEIFETDALIEGHLEQGVRHDANGSPNAEAFIPVAPFIYGGKQFRNRTRGRPAIDSDRKNSPGGRQTARRTGFLLDAGGRDIRIGESFGNCSPR